MDKKHINNRLIYVVLLISTYSTGFAQNENILPHYFADSVLMHIEELVKFSPRHAGTSNELASGEYVKNKFQSIGLKTKVERFDYNSFHINELYLNINGKTTRAIGLGYIPYLNVKQFSGNAIIIDSKKPQNKLSVDDIYDNTIISNDFTNHFTLLQLQPNLIIYIDSVEFLNFDNESVVKFELRINGEIESLCSQNIIAQLGNDDSNSSEIIIGAHVDSYRTSPGASDNASGVGVMIEIARYLKTIENKLNYIVKFIAFGAEEVGILGSRRYILANPQIGEKCKLYYNIDDVGGNGQGAIAILGGVNVPSKLPSDNLSQILSRNPWEGNPSYWRVLPTPLLMGYITAINHPYWLVDVVDEAVSSSNYQIRYVQSLGADDMSFSYAGIPSTSIGITGDNPHTPYDKTECININSLRKAGEISIRIILNTNNQ